MMFPPVRLSFGLLNVHLNTTRVLGFRDRDGEDAIRKLSRHLAAVYRLWEQHSPGEAGRAAEQSLCRQCGLFWLLRLGGNYMKKLATLRAWRPAADYVPLLVPSDADADPEASDDA